MKRLILLLLMTIASNTAFAADGGYLFVTFKGEQSPMTEQVYFAISQDGRDWEALNDAQPVLVSQLGEKGVRDPFLIRSQDGKKFFLIATDLSINLNGDWKRAVQKGSQSILVWESDDLVHWQEPRLVKVAPDDAGCTWAPEVIYDDATKDYLVFWASTNKGDNFEKHRIWAARTKDFRTFGEPFVYIEKPTTLIDTDIVREGNKYYRFSKDEKYKAITMEVSENLMGPWSDVDQFSLAQLRGYEGPQCYLLEPATAEKPATWCLILDQYSKGTGYHPFITHDIASGQFSPAANFKFPFHFRHGSVVPISTAEYQRLKTGSIKVEAAKP